MEVLSRSHLIVFRIRVGVLLKYTESDLNGNISRPPIPSIFFVADKAQKLSMAVKESGVAMGNVKLRRSIEHSGIGE